MSIRGEHRTSTFNSVKDPSFILHFFDDVRHFDVNVDLVEKHMIAWVRYYVSYEEEQLWRQLSTVCDDNYELFKKEVLSFYPNVTSLVLGSKKPNFLNFFYCPPLLLLESYLSEEPHLISTLCL